MSHFAGRGKKTAWNTWLAYRDVTETFVRSSTLEEFNDEDFFHLQRFVILLYDNTSGLADVNVCRKYLFTKRGRPIEKCPLTKDALSQHAKQAKLVSNIWISCLDAYHPEPDFNKWGWRLEDGYLAPRWTTLPDAS